MTLRRFTFSMPLLLASASVVGTVFSIGSPAAVAASYVEDLVKRAEGMLKSTDATRDPGLAVALLREAVRQNNTYAMRVLATVMAKGDAGVPADAKQSETLLKQSIASGDVSLGAESLGDFYLADTPLKDPAKAAASFQRSVDAGNAAAMVKLANLLTTGSDGVPADPARAETLLIKATSATDAPIVGWAANTLGDFYRLETPLKSPTKSAAAFELGVGVSNPDSMLKLARLLTVGDGLPADAVRAENLIKQAIAAGDPQGWGRLALGEFYSTPSPLFDRAKAAAAFEDAAKSGGPFAKLRLAAVLTIGEGTRADPPRAESLIRQVMDGGGVSAGADALGNFYLAKTAVRDPAKAAAAYEQAANAGNKESMLKLASLLTTGDRGVQADPARAEALVMRSIAAGNKLWGFFALAQLYIADTPLRDPAKAAGAFQKAIDAGNTSAMQRLALMLAMGEGVPVDARRAETLLQRAIAMGDVSGGAFALGEVYRNKTPLRDPAKAVAAYEQSANAGNTAAMRALAGMLTKGDGIAVDFPRAEKLLAQAVGAGDVADAAFALGELYSGENPLKDPKKAVVAYAQAAGAGNGWANLALALIASNNPVDVASLRDMADNFGKASALLGADVVLGTVFRLPGPALVAMVQQRLDDKGGATLKATGVHTPPTAAAIASYCRKNKIADCNPNFVTASLIQSLVLQ